jgi:asparagine synthase (glutamine-hydrolysing)
MCGIAGLFDARGIESANAADTVGRMADTLIHRGPDDSGIWVDAKAGVALAHRRLAILDLSPTGSQPMTSACNRYVMVFNGEIYNHLELRRELGAACGHTSWRGRSDTETLLAAIARWGIDTALKKSVGMFALAVWDRRERVLSLARDRLGEKPLYYGSFAGSWAFASELRAFRAHAEFFGEVDREALTLFVRHDYVPAPWSIYKHVSKLLPGTIASIDCKTPLGRVVAREYWSAGQVVSAQLAAPFEGEEADAVTELERLIGQSIAGQMVADVPVGAFLSGGIDSSTIAALMQARSAKPIKTFSIGFEEQAFNEAAHASKVAHFLRTDHQELYITARDALDVVPTLATLYDEPFADSSQVPTCLMMQLARRHVTVALSGDGGDELFGGYNRHFWASRVWRRANLFPAALRRRLARTLVRVRPADWDRAARFVGLCLPRSLRFKSVGDKVHKLAAILEAPTEESVYSELVSHWTRPEEVVLQAQEPARPLSDSGRGLPDSCSSEERMMFLDLVTYLPDDILVKVDRAAMGVSLEARVPLLDHRVVEFAWQLPLDLKVAGVMGKRVLREVLYRHVPRELVDRPKMGFGIPLDAWLRGPLRDWAESLLSESRLTADGFFDASVVRRRWVDHVSGRFSSHYHLWDILMFQAWHEKAARSSSEQRRQTRERPGVVYAEPLASA